MEAGGIPPRPSDATPTARRCPRRGIVLQLRDRLSPHSRAAAMTEDQATPNATAATVLRPRVGIIMGSRSDWGTMQHAADVLKELGIPYAVEVVSAHRTPDKLFDYAEAAEARGLEVIIAGAGGAAHLPGMCAAKTVLPVLGVPVESKALKGIDSLLSIVQMPGGVPVGTLAIGKPGAINAALLATAMLGAA